MLLSLPSSSRSSPAHILPPSQRSPSLDSFNDWELVDSSVPAHVPPHSHASKHRINLAKRLGLSSRSLPSSPDRHRSIWPVELGDGLGKPMSVLAPNPLLPHSIQHPLRTHPWIIPHDSSSANSPTLSSSYSPPLTQPWPQSNPSQLYSLHYPPLPHLSSPKKQSHLLVSPNHHHPSYSSRPTSSTSHTIPKSSNLPLRHPAPPSSAPPTKLTFFPSKLAASSDNILLPTDFQSPSSLSSSKFKSFLVSPRFRRNSSSALPPHQPIQPGFPLNQAPTKPPLPPTSTSTSTGQPPPAPGSQSYRPRKYSFSDPSTWHWPKAFHSKPGPSSSSSSSSSSSTPGQAHHRPNHKDLYHDPAQVDLPPVAPHPQLPYVLPSSPSMPNSPRLRNNHDSRLIHPQLERLSMIGRPFIPIRSSSCSGELSPPVKVLPPVPQKVPLDHTQSSGRLNETERFNNELLRQSHKLREMKCPSELIDTFVSIASPETDRGVELCGLLLGKITSDHTLVITTLLIPKQISESDTCFTTNEDELFKFQFENDLLTFGWIHTHPTQTCFMSSLDLHTHASYQAMLDEAIAIVCSPKFEPAVGVFRLTDPPGLKFILECKSIGAFHPHPDGLPIYTDADQGGGHFKVMRWMHLDVVDLRKKM